MTAPTLAATFKAKVQTMHTHTGERLYVQMPALTRKHVDMNVARTHPTFGAYANSDMFQSMLAHGAPVRTGGFIYLDCLPDGITVDTSGFLASVTVQVKR